MGKKATLNNSKNFGLLGKTLSHSFSRSFFLEKFKNLGLDAYSYTNIELKDESELAYFLLDEVYRLKGFNVTIPYKEKIIPYLDELDDTARSVLAVNTVAVKKNKLIGYNTDVYGFMISLKPLLTNSHKQALIFGTGGASKAVAYALDLLGITYKFVSRKKGDNTVIEYKNLNQDLIEKHQIMINCTPIGTYPLVDECIDIPYQYIKHTHIVFDLVYNPTESLYLKKAKTQGATILNGLEMLKLQAEKSWIIWHK